MVKAFSLFFWKNQPSVDTPLGERLLNQVNVSLDTVDSRVVNFDTTKANQTDLLTAVADVTYNESTGVFTVTKKNGSKTTIDTKLEKLAINFTYDSINQQLVIHLDDGTYQYVDLKALITELEFLNSNTVLFSVTNGKVTANIAQGSITADMLEPNYLANVQLYASQALESANDARTYADNASTSASQADGNAKLAKQYAKSANDAVEVVNQKLKLATFSFDANGHLIYSDDSAYAFTVDNTRGMLQYELAQ